MLIPGCFAGAFLFSDLPFAERVVSVISAFLVRLVSIAGTDDQGVAWNFVVGARPKLGAPEVRSLRAARDDHWCVDALASAGAG